MARRILVKCSSQSIPGDPRNRDQEMAKIICMHEWGRDFDASADSHLSLGQYEVNGSRCYFVLDNGSPESTDPEITVYRWDGNQLNQRPVYPALVAYLRTVPFRQPSSNNIGLSDDEFRAIHGEEEFRNLLQQRIEQKRRWGYRLLPVEKEFLEQHPELAKEA